MPDHELSVITPERDVAKDIADRLRAKLVEVGAIMDEAVKHRMRVDFALASDGFGRNVVAKLDITKSLL